jgi:lauroyl/myristoyl acyltransferase
MHYRPIKDAVALPLHRFGNLLAWLPENFSRAILASIGGLAKAGYFVPGSPIPQTVGNFCRAAGRSDPWPVYSRMIRNVERAALHYATLFSYGRSKLLSQTVIDPSLTAEYQRLGSGKRGLMILVPHCVGAVLSSAALSNFCPTTLLVREPRSPARCQLMLEYVQKLGPKYILSRTVPPATVMRNIVRSLRDGQVVVGTTDVVTRGADTVETEAFGERIHSPAWPARISARFGVPIVPGFIRMDGPQITILTGEGYQDADIRNSTQRWVSNFERWFRQYPSDWAFMLDKHWGRVFSTAAAAAPEPSRFPPRTRAPAPMSSRPDPLSEQVEVVECGVPTLPRLDRKPEPARWGHRALPFSVRAADGILLWIRDGILQ